MKKQDKRTLICVLQDRVLDAVVAGEGGAGGSTPDPKD